ncbi:hypothetical protein [Turicimonas muris]|uniref:Uncharacterized protein n=4 Tax=Turicimonas muris TaxID=1796652 RepID=A0A227KJ67_9BURK|nr:hypothetical protein [Turicimonas muris]ANU66581.1 hypothetical protein A4V04_09245 [Burkholderiales bacterium YL45]MBS4768612.1 hypothetical protein [Burkholderiales bacterium]OXE47226.1 hypothetical protein ADH67_08680 [Turicimonas muris]QQQ97730.1 hypothetical protein I5Q81_05255 [Turicimonas muris]
MLYEYIRNKINLPFVDGTIRELQKQAKSIYKVRDNPVELASDSMIWALVALADSVPTNRRKEIIEMLVEFIRTHLTWNYMVGDFDKHLELIGQNFIADEMEWDVFRAVPQDFSYQKFLRQEWSETIVVKDRVERAEYLLNMILIHIAELLSYLREFDDAKKMNLGFIGSLMTVSCSLEGLVGSFTELFYEPKN